MKNSKNENSHSLKSLGNLSIQLRDLEYLVILERTNHFRKAAEECNVSQPTISGQIKKLEDSLGIQIVERSNRKVLFTHTGILIVEQAKKILEDMRVLKELAMQLRNEMTGSIHIGIIPTLAPYVITHLIHSFKELYPGLELFFVEDYTTVLAKKLSLGELDFIIIAEHKEAEHFILNNILEEEIYLLVHKDHKRYKKSRKVAVDLAEFDEDKFLLLNDLHCFKGNVLNLCEAHNLGVDNRFNSSSLFTIRRMVSSSMGVSLVPKLSTTTDEKDSCRLLRIQNNPMRKLQLAYRPGSPLKERYLNCLNVIKKNFADLDAKSNI